MSSTVTFPSETFPPFPALSLDLPDGWQPVQAPDAVLAAVRPAGDAEFTPNVVVGLTRVPLDEDITPSVEALTAETRALPEVAVVAAQPADVGGLPGYALEVSYVHEAAGTAVQCHRLALVPRGEAQDLLHAVGSCGASHAVHDVEELRGILGSISIER
jgi:hypothetical protein